MNERDQRSSAAPRAPTPIADASTVAFARSLLVARRRRNELLAEIDFADMKWPMLVDLFVAAERGDPLALSSLYEGQPVAKATALRVIARMVESGHLVREPDPKDGRRSLVWLSPPTHSRVNETLARMRSIVLGGDL